MPLEHVCDLFIVRHVLEGVIYALSHSSYRLLPSLRYLLTVDQPAWMEGREGGGGGRAKGEGQNKEEIGDE